MASFVEQATLRVNDQSTAQINKINAALKKLFATAKSLKSIKVGINVDARGLTAANKQLNTLARNIAVLRNQRLSLNVNDAGLAKARRDIAALRAAARVPINVNVSGGMRRPVPVTPAGGAAAVPPRRRGGRTPGGAIVTGAGAGAGISGISRLETSFGALSLAAYGAAAALKKVGEAGYERARTDLQTKAMTTATQRAVSANLPPSFKGAPIAWPKNAFDQFVNEIAGDVAATDKVTGKADEAQTRRNAELVARHMQNDIYPGIMARNPTFTPEQGREGLKKIVKAANIATTEIVDDAGKLSSDYQRYSKGVSMALAVNPELKPETVRTTIAGLKTQSYALDSEGIAQTLVQAGDLGQRVGNETFRLTRALQGVVDNKKLNNVLRDRGILINPEEDAKGNVKPSTGSVAELSKLLSNPSQRIRDEFQGDIDKHLAKSDTKKRIAAAAGTSGTDEEKEARRKQAEQVERVGVLGRILPSLPQTALNQLNQLILGAEQWERQKAQAGITPGSAETGKLVAENPAIMWENLKTAVGDASGSIGELAMSSKAATGIMQGLTNIFRGEPTTPDQKGALVFGAAVTTAITAAVASAIAAPVVALTGAGTALTGSAAALTAAAARLGAAGGVPGVPDGGMKKTPAKTVMDYVKEGAKYGAAIALPLAIPLATGITETPGLSDTADAAKKAEESTLSLAYAQLDLHNKTKQLADLEAERIAPKAETPFDRFQPTYPAQVEAEKETLRSEIAQLSAAINSWQAGSRWEDAFRQVQQQPPAEQQQPNWVAGAIAELKKAQLPPDWKQTPEPIGGKPETQWPDPTAISTASEAMGAAMNSGGMQIQGAANTLLSTTGTFSTVFATGAQAIGSSGQIAASTLQGAAPGIGASIGSAAAAAIQAAVSNLNVNVNVNQTGGGGDKGNINNANGNK